MALLLPILRRHRLRPLPQSPVGGRVPVRVPALHVTPEWVLQANFGLACANLLKPKQLKKKSCLIPAIGLLFGNQKFAQANLLILKRDSLAASLGF